MTFSGFSTDKLDLKVQFFCVSVVVMKLTFFILLKRFTQREKEDKLLPRGNSAPLTTPHAILTNGYMFAR